MIYLDYSATTPVNDDVLDTYVKVCQNYIGNPNSLHQLGQDANKLIKQATKQVADIMGVKEKEIIYTSGASEANNLALKGIAFKYANRGKHIITSPLEHSSINEPLNFLKELGYEVSYVKLDQNGKVDLGDLKHLMRDDTILVSICAVNSELGIVEPIDEIGKIIRDYPKCYFHTDLTQAIGKIKIPLDNVDLASFSAHKFYGMKGIGVLIKKDKIELEPLIHGGDSTTIYRSGTPTTALIVSLAKALRLVNEHLSNDIDKKNTTLRRFFKTLPKVTINSPEDALPHILNISVLGVKPESMLHALEMNNVYISTKSACSSHKSLSEAVYSVTGNTDRASSSLRISISYLTTDEEITMFMKVFKKCYEELACLK